MPIAPAVVDRLVRLADEVRAAPYGSRGALYDAACAELGLARATLMRHLHTVTLRAQRKRRADAGEVTLPRQEAETISALLMESMRRNNKRLLSITQAVAELRANGLVRAEGVDADGVIRPLSDSAISRALRRYTLHPDQLLRPAPAVELRSLHPNHVWQIDASLCVLYYLHAERSAEAGLQVMDHDRFYKNKPRNLKAIENDRIWSYEVTDHYSGSIFAHYVLGAESGANLIESFIAAMQPRGDEPMHGVPLILMFDRGPANLGALFGNLTRRLGIEVIPHARGNARATGQVEKARDIIEKSFESSLKLMPVHGLESLNAALLRWARWLNGNVVHSRHGRTRYAMWQTISTEQLRLAPPPAICRELVTHQPETRTVTDKLRVPFGGYGEFDVSSLPNVVVGEKLAITFNPYDIAGGTLGSVMVVTHDADGHETLHRCPAVQRDEAGFAVTGNVIGEDWKRPADTVADVNRKLVQRIAMGAETDTEAEAARRAKRLPFGGRIDPFKHIEQAPDATWMPKRGTPLELKTSLAGQGLPARVLRGFELAAELARRGAALNPERNALLAQWHPDGVPEDAIDDVIARLAARSALRLVAGGGAET